MPYTLPMLLIECKDGKQTTIRESEDIVKYINQKYPNPPIDMDDPISQGGIGMFKSDVGLAFSGLIITAVPEHLPQRSKEYFYETREKNFGCSLAQYRKDCIEKGAWTEMEKWINEVDEMLGKNGGPFFLVEKLSMQDIRLIGFMMWIKESGHKEDSEKAKGLWGESLRKWWKAVEPHIE